MQVIESLENLDLSSQPRAVAVGAFDGFHVGHQYLLTQLCGLAWSRGLQASLLTFEPIPAEYFAPPDSPPKRLTTHDERVALAAALCCDLMVVLRFDAAFAATSAERFCREILVERLKVKLVMASRNHTLGRDRADLDGIRRLGERLGFEVVAAPVLQLGDLRVSSSEVRRLLSEGHVEEVAGLLGRRYHLRGQVVRNRGVGGRLGYPTANLDTPPGKILPADAVYAGFALEEDGAGQAAQVYPAAISIGHAPTFALGQRLVEAHLLTDAPLELAGRALRLEFVRRLRWQQTFASAQALRRQIAADVAETARLCAAAAAMWRRGGAGQLCTLPHLPGCAMPEPPPDQPAPTAS